MLHPVVGTTERFAAEACVSVFSIGGLKDNRQRADLL
jgi:hypothetical protein